MAELKGVIFSMRNVLVTSGTLDKDKYQETIKLLKFLISKGIEPVFASNAEWNVVGEQGKQPFETVFQEEVGDIKFFYGGQNMDWKPRAGAVSDILADRGWSNREVVYVGNSETDMRTASNGKIMFLNALWHGEANPYGFQFGSARDIARFIDCLCIGVREWFWALEDGPLKVYALGPFATYAKQYGEAHEYSEGARATAKFHVPDDEFWGRMLSARLYFSGLVDEIDYVTSYPGHKPDSDPPEVVASLNILAGSLRKKYLPDMILRHTTSQKSQSARNQNQPLDATNQLNTIKLEPLPQMGPDKKRYVRPPLKRGKTVLIVDDFCTEGHSFEAARAFVEATGAKAICVAWLKTVNTHYQAISSGFVADAYKPAFSDKQYTVKAHGYRASVRDWTVTDDLAEVYKRYQNWDWD